MIAKPYAEVIGDPIAHSKSPLIHGFWLEKLGIDAEYRACHVRPGELAGYFASRRADPTWRGCNVTIPHKEAVSAFLDFVEPRAQRIGAVNTVWKEGDLLYGRNTDVEGVSEALSGVDLAGRDVVVIGAGGAARSAFAHLEGLGCASVRVLARNPEKANAVVSDFNLPVRSCLLEKGSHAFRDAALVINATQLGMSGQAQMPPFVLDELGEMAPGGQVFDMVYAPRETELLKSAARLGHHPVGGLVMLVGQARGAFARFFGSVPSREFDTELYGLLSA